jgi:hypothetical protein
MKSYVADLNRIFCRLAEQIPCGSWGYGWGGRGGGGYWIDIPLFVFNTVALKSALTQEVLCS